MTDLREAKFAARASARIVRGRTASMAFEAGACVRDRFLTEVRLEPGAVVAGYWPAGTELDVRALLTHLAENGHPCCLPVVEERNTPLVFRAWAPGDTLRSGAFGIQEPLESAPTRVPGVLLVPMLAFDRAGFRLGYGAGFYDRTLAALRTAGPTLAVGVAYAGQEIESVPRDEFDQRLDWIVTESFTLRVESAD